MSAASSNAGTGAAVETKAAAQAGLDEQGERVRGIFSKIARRYELFKRPVEPGHLPPLAERRGAPRRVLAHRPRARRRGRGG